MKYFKIFFAAIIFISILNQSIIAKNDKVIKTEGNTENKLLHLRYDFNKYNNLFASSELSKGEVSGKSPWIAFFLSMLLPTSGQLYNGDYTKAIIQAGLMLGGGGLVTTMACVECGDYGTAQTGLLIVGAAMLISGYFWSIIDAPMSANRINDELKNKNQAILGGIETSGTNHKLYISSNNLISIKIKF